MAAERQAFQDRSRFLWPALAWPGTIWLIVLFVVPFYGILAVAFSSEYNILRQPIPAWNPLDWNFATFSTVLEESVSGIYRTAWERRYR